MSEAAGRGVGNPASASEEPEAQQSFERPRMRPLSEFAQAARSKVNIVLTDIDDTLTKHRRLPVVAYSAMERLRAAGKIVVPVTGRPAGWCDLIARLWPVDAVVGENGAFYFRCGADGTMRRGYCAATAERLARQRDLQRIKDQILKEVPRARVAADQAYREFDLAIDFAEEVERLTDAEIDRIVDCFTAAGATAKVSSIHVNGWYGDYDKLAMTRRLLEEVFGIDIDEANEQIVFVGDAPNDEPMFGYFENGVGVANFAAFANQVRAKPRWMTLGEGGEGFAELADALLTATEP
jgi:HAD superfamily hydrolase (TIGR01484 family)